MSQRREIDLPASGRTVLSFVTGTLSPASGLALLAFCFLLLAFSL